MLIVSVIVQYIYWGQWDAKVYNQYRHKGSIEAPFPQLTETEGMVAQFKQPVTNFVQSLLVDASEEKLLWASRPNLYRRLFWNTFTTILIGLVTGPGLMLGMKLGLGIDPPRGVPLFSFLFVFWDWLDWELWLRRRLRYLYVLTSHRALILDGGLVGDYQVSSHLYRKMDRLDYKISTSGYGDVFYSNFLYEKGEGPDPSILKKIGFTYCRRADVVVKTIQHYKGSPGQPPAERPKSIGSDNQRLGYRAASMAPMLSPVERDGFWNRHADIMADLVEEHHRRLSDDSEGSKGSKGSKDKLPTSTPNPEGDEPSKGSKKGSKRKKKGSKRSKKGHKPAGDMPPPPGPNSDAFETETDAGEAAKDDARELDPDSFFGKLALGDVEGAEAARTGGDSDNGSSQAFVASEDGGAAGGGRDRAVSTLSDRMREAEERQRIADAEAEAARVRASSTIAAGGHQSGASLGDAHDDNTPATPEPPAVTSEEDDSKKKKKTGSKRKKGSKRKAAPKADGGSGDEKEVGKKKGSARKKKGSHRKAAGGDDKPARSTSVNKLTKAKKSDPPVGASSSKLPDLTIMQGGKEAAKEKAKSEAGSRDTVDVMMDDLDNLSDYIKELERDFDLEKS